VNHVFGLELIGSFTVDLVNPSDAWGNGFPSDKMRLLEPGSEYYIPPHIKDIDINFDLQAQCAIQGAAVTVWYYSQVQSIQIGVRHDESTAWTWYDGGPARWLNEQVIITIPLTVARYVSIRLRGGSIWGGGSTWGLRQVQISGSMNPI
jgi:hypothetical protein